LYYTGYAENRYISAYGGFVLMKKEREILLAPEEIQQLLEGGLYWKDISSRLSSASSNDFPSLNIKEDLDLEEVTRSLTAANEDEEEKSVRAILFGENKKYTESAADVSFEAETEPEPEPELTTQKDTAVRTEDAVVINRQIDLSRMEADLKAQPLSELKEQPIPAEPKPILNESKPVLDEPKPVLDEPYPFLDEPEVDNEFKSILTEQNVTTEEKEQELDEEEEEERTPFGGLKLIILLVVVAALTFAFWYYFLDL